MFHIAARKTAGRLVVLAAALLAAGSPGRPVAARQAAPSPAVLAITGGTLVDGTGRAPIAGATILAVDGRIARVGRASDVEVPPGATLVDARGQYVVPGLIDAHVHYRDWLGELFLAHGVTSVFDLGDPSDWILALRDAVDQGLLRAPRLYVSANIIDGVTEAPRSGSSGSGGGLGRANRTLVRSVDEARRETRALIARDVDFVKVYQDLAPDELAAVAEEAHKAGLAVLGHTYDVGRAVALGLDVPTHLWGVGTTCMPADVREAFDKGRIACPYTYIGGAAAQALIAQMVAKGASINPLLINEHAGLNPKTPRFVSETYDLLALPDLRYVPEDPRLGLLAMFSKVRNYASRFGTFPPLSKLPPDVQEQFRTGYERARTFVGEFVKAGGTVVAGTDTAGASMTPGLALHQELELLVDAGLTPMQALQSATRNAGALVRSRDKVGTIEPGARADLLVLTANPLEDVRNLRKIATVVKDGRVVDTTYHADYSSPLPYPLAEYSSSFVPVPSLSDIEPKAAPVGGGPVTLTVKGAAFSMLSSVFVGGTPVATRFVSPSRLEATVPADRLLRPATIPVTVRSPRPGGGESVAYGFVVAPRARVRSESSR